MRLRNIAIFLLIVPSSLSAQDMSVNDPRPVAKAAELLEKFCLCQITYEDPPYLSERDLRDVTDQVAPQQRERRILVPSGGSLRVNARHPSGEKLDPEAALTAILNQDAARTGAPYFALRRSPSILHLIPLQMTGADGKLVPVKPILDTEIFGGPSPFSALAWFEELCRQLTLATGGKVILGTTPRAFLGAQQLGEIPGGPARHDSAGHCRPAGSSLLATLL